MNPIIYIQQVSEELARITWPNRKTAVRMAAIVIAVSVLVGLYVGGLDSIFTVVLNDMIKR